MRRAGALRLSDTTGSLSNMRQHGWAARPARRARCARSVGSRRSRWRCDNTENVPRTLRLSFEGYGQGASTTERVVELAARQRLTTHLLIPAPVSSGMLTVSGPGIRSSTRASTWMRATRLTAVVLGPSKALRGGDRGFPAPRTAIPPNVQVRFIPVQDAPGELAAYVGYHAGDGDGGSGLGALAMCGRALEDYAAVGGSLADARPPRDLAAAPAAAPPELSASHGTPTASASVHAVRAGATTAARVTRGPDSEAAGASRSGQRRAGSTNRFALTGARRR